MAIVAKLEPERSFLFFSSFLLFLGGACCELQTISVCKITLYRLINPQVNRQSEVLRPRSTSTKYFFLEERRIHR